jgi:hypothetical protein
MLMYLLSVRTLSFLKSQSFWFSSFFFLVVVNCFAQESRGILKGRVIDGRTFHPVARVSVLSNKTSDKKGWSSPDGSYLLSLSNGKHNVTFRMEGYQSKTISLVQILNDQITYLDIILDPVFSPRHRMDTTITVADSAARIVFHQETRRSVYNERMITNWQLHKINQNSNQTETDFNGSQLIKRLNAVILLENPRSQNTQQSLNISGLGERYNQAILNGAVLNSFDPVSRTFPFGIFPSETIESVSVQRIGNASMHGDFAGGTVEIKTKDVPDYNFYYVKVGAGFSDVTIGNEFFGDKRGTLETLSFPGKIRDLPGEFPTTRSQSALHQKNPQEQVYLSKLLKNNLAPVNHGASKPNDVVVIGYGKAITLKKEESIGIVGYVHHQKVERIDQSVVQTAPSVRGNPFPYDPAGVLIQSFSSDVNFRYASQLNAMLNASIVFGRNKISFRNLFSSQVNSNHIQRSGLYKPDEDTLSHTGLSYFNEQRKYLNTQLSGEHAFGSNGKFRMDWLASYSYYRQKNPDEQNFLLREDSTGNNTFELARPVTGMSGSIEGMFTNSGRLWRNYTDHHFTGAVNLHIPFDVLNRSQVLSGGLYIQSKYRLFYSDLFLTQGPGYFSLENILHPDRYFPGGLSVTNYFKNFFIRGGTFNPDAINPTHRGNYTASANLGAGYIMLKSSFTNQLTVNWGVRLESNSQLVSTSQYNYFKGYKNAQLGTLDENDRVTSSDLFPSVDVKYKLLKKILLHASYFKSTSRPQMEELARYRYYDASLFLVRSGNPLLANSLIQNFDAGVDWILSAGTSISVAGFYKDIHRPIEYIVSGYGNARGNVFSTPHNTPPAFVRGVTVSMHLKPDFVSAASWLSHILLFANGTWLKSKVSDGPIRSLTTPNVAEHTLSGSPEYTLNTGLIINHPRFPQLSVLYYLTDDYISAVGSGTLYTLSNGNTISAIPDYHVKGRDQLDIQVSQKIFKSKFQVTASVFNILNNRYIEYQDLNGNKRFDAPLIITANPNRTGGFFQSGIDNTLLNNQAQRTYCFTLSYLFN